MPEGKLAAYFYALAVRSPVLHESSHPFNGCRIRGPTLLKFETTSYSAHILSIHVVFSHSFRRSSPSSKHPPHDFECLGISALELRSAGRRQRSHGLLRQIGPVVLYPEASSIT